MGRDGQEPRRYTREWADQIKERKSAYKLIRRNKSMIEGSSKVERVWGRENNSNKGGGPGNALVWGGTSEKGGLGGGNLAY